jgi:hypothetical protein
VDILCLHEVKTIGFMLHMALSIIWSDTKVLVSVDSEDKGGLAILKSPYFGGKWLTKAQTHLKYLFGFCLICLDGGFLC